MDLKRQLPFAVALVFGLLTLSALLLDLSGLRSLILGWTAFLAAIALVLGVLNLFSVHVNRMVSERNLYSGILVLSMLVVIGLAITDAEGVNLTDDGVNAVFRWIQAPLEAALASLMAFFLLFAGFRLLRQRRGMWSVLFLLTAVTLLLTQVLAQTALVPTEVADLLVEIRTTINDILVMAGMRGILIGVALGTITISLRLLAGQERPYGQ